MSCTAVGIIPRVHGSGLFQRGQTVCHMSVLTLGTRATRRSLTGWPVRSALPASLQLPPFSTGETVLQIPSAVNRHGMLGEYALKPVRLMRMSSPPCVVSEVSARTARPRRRPSARHAALMTAVCRSSAVAAGDGPHHRRGKYAILTDIQGMEGPRRYGLQGRRDERKHHHAQMDIKIRAAARDHGTGPAAAREARMKIRGDAVNIRAACGAQPNAAHHHHEHRPGEDPQCHRHGGETIRSISRRRTRGSTSRRTARSLRRLTRGAAALRLASRR